MANNYRLVKFGNSPKVPQHIETMVLVAVGFLALLAIVVIIGLLYFVFTQPFVAVLIISGLTGAALFVWLAIFVLKALFRC